MKGFLDTPAAGAPCQAPASYFPLNPGCFSEQDPEKHRAMDEIVPI